MTRTASPAPCRAVNIDRSKRLRKIPKIPISLLYATRGKIFFSFFKILINVDCKYNKQEKSVTFFNTNINVTFVRAGRSYHGTVSPAVRELLAAVAAGFH